MCPYKYWRITLSTIAPKMSDKDVEIVELKNNYRRGEDGKPTQEQIGYLAEFLCTRGTTQSVKLPLTAKENVRKAQEALDREAVVRGKLIDLDMKVYSMLGSNGKPLTGITATASDLEIIKIEEADCDGMIEF